MGVCSHGMPMPPASMPAAAPRPTGMVVADRAGRSCGTGPLAGLPIACPGAMDGEGMAVFVMLVGKPLVSLGLSIDRPSLESMKVLRVGAIHVAGEFSVPLSALETAALEQFSTRNHNQMV
jgi:hypothetical protein